MVRPNYERFEYLLQELNHKRKVELQEKLKGMTDKKKINVLEKSYKEITTAEIARELGIARSTISRWKTGKQYIKFERLALIAKYFGVSVLTFYDEEE